MDTAIDPSPEIDLHRLELRFAGTRLADPRAVAQLARSIGDSGQLIPCIVVPESGSDRLVLVDGYRRIAAIQRLGRDTANVQRWECDLGKALLRVLAHAKARHFAAIEEALLVRELSDGFGLSLQEIARQSGRDVSWVSRRRQLINGASDELLAAVRAGQISTWAASRVFAPLARANSEDAAQLLRAVIQTPLSTRELNQWFTHYQKANRGKRERLLMHPRLFLDALQANDDEHATAQLRDGPEGECLADCQRMAALATRLGKGLPRLDASALPEALSSAFSRLATALDSLQNDLNRYCDHDPGRYSQRSTHTECARPAIARDQPPAQSLA